MADGTSIVTRLVVSAPEVNQEIGRLDIPDPDVTCSLNIASPITVRQVRVEAVESTGGNTGAAEIQFFA